MDQSTENIFSKSYYNVLMNFILDISQRINQGGVRYEKHLKTLNQLISSGKTDKNVVEAINKHLVERIESVHHQHSRMNILIKEDPEGLRKLISEARLSVRAFLYSGQDLNGKEAIAFKNKLKDQISEGINEIFFMGPAVVRVFCDPADSTFEITEEYIKNYMGQNKPNPDAISFSDEAILKYYHFIEYKISEKIASEDEPELLNDRIKNTVNFFLKNVMSKIENVDIDLFDEQVVSFLSSSFAWLDNSTKSPEIEEQLEDFKIKVRQKIIKLSESANDEVFPKLLESRIKESKDKYQEVTLKITSLITDLDNRRKELIKEIKEEGLYEYANFADLESIWDYDYKFAVKKKDEISEAPPAMVLKSFIRQRQVKADVIRDLLSKDSDRSYVGIKNKIDNLDALPQEESDEIVRYFIVSVRSFANDLESTVIGDLDADFSEISERINPRSLQCDREIKAVRDEEKTLMNQEKQLKINKLLGSMTQYQLPEGVVLDILSKISLDTDEDVSVFLKSYSEAQFCSFVAKELEDQSLEVLFSKKGFVDLSSLSMEITKFRVQEVGNYISALKGVIKDVISNESIVGMVVKTSANVLAPGLGMGFELLTGLFEARQKNKEDLADFRQAVRSILSTAIQEVGSAMVRDKFEAELKK